MAGVRGPGRGTTGKTECRRGSIECAGGGRGSIDIVAREGRGRGDSEFGKNAFIILGGGIGHISSHDIAREVKGLTVFIESGKNAIGIATIGKGATLRGQIGGESDIEIIGSETADVDSLSENEMPVLIKLAVEASRVMIPASSQD